MSQRCGAVCGGGVQEGTLTVSRPSVISPAIHKQIGPFWCWSPGGGFVHILGPCGSLQWTLLWGWEFLPLLQPPQIITARGFEALFPCTGPLGCAVSLVSQSFLLVYAHSNVGPPSLLVAALPAPSTNHSLAAGPLHPSYLSLSLLPVWMNVSSLTTWLSDFHTFWFFGSSSYFLFLKLLSFFWLCDEAKCIYLHLHLGWKSLHPFSYWISCFQLSSDQSWHFKVQCGALIKTLNWELGNSVLVLEF